MLLIELPPEMGGVVKLGKPKGRSPVSLWDLGSGQKGRRCGLKL